MRIDELEKEIEKLGQKYDKIFTIEKIKDFNGNSYIKVYVDYQGDNYKIALIDLEIRYDFSVTGIWFDKLPEELQKELFDILVKFARTPVNEREEVKRYQYRLKEKYLWIDKRLNLGNCYLNIQSFQDGSEQKVLDNRGNTNSFKAKFTDEEIKEVAEKFDVDLEMFDKIEVE